jgi:hypothetical protein
MAPNGDRSKTSLPSKRKGTLESVPEVFLLDRETVAGVGGLEGMTAARLSLDADERHTARQDQTKAHEEDGNRTVEEALESNEVGNLHDTHLLSLAPTIREPPCHPHLARGGASEGLSDLDSAQIGPHLSAVKMIFTSFG